MEIDKINSNNYWDSRFSTDWESFDGPLQSRFFAQLAIDNLPPWLFEQVRKESLTVADWGCAQGDGTDVLAGFVNPGQLVGVDFSETAIKQASERYPKIAFRNENWLKNSNSEELFDIVFSSNTLEHFGNPYEVLKILTKKAKKAVVLALPYREKERIPEHFHSFFPENIPLHLNVDFQLVWSRIVNCENLPKTQWPGEQVFLIFSESKWIASLELTLSNCEIQSNQIKYQNSSLSQAVEERDGQIASLSQAVEERNGQIVSLNQAVAERDEQIASLNKATVGRDGQIAILKSDLLNIKKSVSWRVTWPIRLLKDLATEPRHAVYRILQAIFWRLPKNFRKKLKHPADALVNYLRPLSPSKKIHQQNINSKDLSWDEFNAKVLSKRSKYKGIFIQERIIDWNVPLYQRPQQIASALGKIGYLVVYKTANWTADDVDGFREVAKNVWLTNRCEIDEVSGVVTSLYSTAYANAHELLEGSNTKKISIYEYIDHIDSEISGDKDNINRLIDLKNFAFSGGVDFIVASAKKLQEEAIAAIGRDKVILIPNGVDTDHYRNPAHRHTALPENYLVFRKDHKIVVGYFGALAPWLWYESIAELVAMRPDIGFVFIGPDYYGGSEKLPRSNNALCLGAVDYKVLPAYAKLFDVCFIPFKPGDIAKTTSPLKLFEYFALEKPVVVTSVMDECTAYPEVFRGGSVEELNDAINAAILVKDQEFFKSRLKELADQNDWLQRAKSFETCFSALIDPTIEDLIRVFNVSRAFIEQYKTNNPNLNWAASSSKIFLDGMDSLSRMYVEFAMSCVLRGNSMATLIDSTGLLQHKRRYLDIGTGYGGFPVAFAGYGFDEVVGIELQDHLVQLATANTVNLPNAMILKRNIVEDNIDDLGYFDLITCNDVIEHVSDPSITIKKLASMLNSFGVVSLEIPNRDCISWIVSDGHFQLFAITLLDRSMAADYFSQMSLGSQEDYFREMGHMHPLDWYQSELNQYGVELSLLGTHKVCNLEDFPVQVKYLEDRFQQWQNDARKILSSVVFEGISTSVMNYLEQVKNEYELAKKVKNNGYFVDKYLRTFWTVVGVKK